MHSRFIQFKYPQITVKETGIWKDKHVHKNRHIKVPLQAKLNKKVNKQVPDIAFMSISVMHLQQLILRDSSFFNPVKRKEKKQH